MSKGEHTFLVGGFVPIGSSPPFVTVAEEDEVEFFPPRIPGRMSRGAVASDGEQDNRCVAEAAAFALRRGLTMPREIKPLPPATRSLRAVSRSCFAATRRQSRASPSTTTKATRTDCRASL
jgi:hypothetical protein